jgi:hypothetical protein
MQIVMASGSVIVLLDVRAKDVSNPSSRDTGVQERGNIRKKERYSTGASIANPCNANFCSGIFNIQDYGRHSSLAW